MTDSNDSKDGIGRRDALKAGALAAGGLAIGSVGSTKATAQTDPERLQLGSEWTLDDKDDGSLVLRNEDSGATLEYDEASGSWSVGSLSTESLFNNSEKRRIVRVDDDTGEYVAQSPTGEISRFTDSGTDAIQAAINDLPNDGGLVLIRKGRYDIADSTFSKTHIEIPSSKSDVTLAGEGFSSEIYLPDNTTETDKGKLIVNAFGDDCTFVNFAINGNQQNQGNIGDLKDGHNIKALGDNFVMRGVKSYNSTGDGVELETDSTPVTENHTITNCIFHNNQEQDCHFHGVKNAAFVGNICTAVHDDGSVAFWTDVADNENIVVANNVILVHPTDGVQGIAIYGTDTSIISKNVHIFGNYISDGTRNIDIDGRYAQELYIYNNTLERARQGAAVWVNSGKDVHIRNNRCKNSQKSDVVLLSDNGNLQNVFVVDNSFKDGNRANTDNDAFQLLARGNSIDRVFVENNAGWTDSSPQYRRIFNFQEDSATTYGHIEFADNYAGAVAFEKYRSQLPIYQYQNTGIDDAVSSTPPASAGRVYLDDGTNTGDSNPGFRYYNGTSWVDL